MNEKVKKVLRFIGQMDMFRIVQDSERHLTPVTGYGSTISMITSLLIALLITSETYHFFIGNLKTSVFVASTSKEKELTEPVNINITFPEMPCAHLRLLVVDEHGSPMNKLMRESAIERYRLVKGDYNTTISIFQGTYEEGEGCRVEGYLLIDNVPGHFLVGSLDGSPSQLTNSKHIIHDVYIGRKKLDLVHDGMSDDVVDPLKNTKHLDIQEGTIFKYYLKVVPSYFSHGKHKKVDKIGYQYTVTHSSHVAAYMPSGLYFSHTHSAIAVEHRLEYDTWSHFIVNTCAIIGGVYTVMGFIAVVVGIIVENPSYEALRKLLGIVTRNPLATPVR